MAWPTLGSRTAKERNGFEQSTLCLKKVSTFKLSVTLSNLHRFFKIYALLEYV